MSPPDALTLEMFENGGAVDPVERCQIIDRGSALVGVDQLSHVLGIEPALHLLGWVADPSVRGSRPQGFVGLAVKLSYQGGQL